MPNILFFSGLGTTKTELFNDLIDSKLVRNDFMSELKQLANVEIFVNPISDILYYKNNDPIYKKKNKFAHTNLNIDTYVDSLKIKSKPPYILIGWSVGIYYCLDFYIKNPKKVKLIISLDGTHWSKKLLLERIGSMKEINLRSQCELNDMVEEIKKGETKYINTIFQYMQYNHTLYMLNNRFYEKNLPIISMRRMIVKDKLSEKDIVKNNNNLEEEKELNIETYYLVNANHKLWDKKESKDHLLLLLDGIISD